MILVRFTIDNRNRLIFYGNTVGYVKDDAAVVDEMFQTDELSRYLARLNLTPQWKEGVFDRLAAGEAPGEELGQPQKGCRIWQLRKGVDVTMRFIGYGYQRFGADLRHLPGQPASRVSGLPDGSVRCGGAVR